MELVCLVICLLLWSRMLSAFLDKTVVQNKSKLHLGCQRVDVFFNGVDLKCIMCQAKVYTIHCMGQHYQLFFNAKIY